MLTYFCQVFCHSSDHLRPPRSCRLKHNVVTAFYFFIFDIVEIPYIHKGIHRGSFTAWNCTYIFKLGVVGKKLRSSVNVQNATVAT